MKVIQFLIVAALLTTLSSVPQSAASFNARRIGFEASNRVVAGGMPPTGATTPQDAPMVAGELTQEQDPELSKLFRKYDVLKLDPAIAAAQIRRTGKLLLGTSAGQFDLKVAPHDLRSADYVAQAIGSDGIAQQLARTPVHTFKGEVRGLPQAQARLTIEPDSIEGSIITKSERYFIQPARALSRAARSDEFVFYRGSDVIKDAGECGVTLADEVAAEEERALSTAGSGSKTSASNFETSEITSLSPLKIVRLATDADAEYVAALGGVAQANNQIVNIMNQVDGIYQVEIGVTFQIVGQNAWTDVATDPYTDLDAGDRLNEFRTRWNSAPPIAAARDLAHLWTGQDLTGSTIGVAFVGVVCVSSSSSYGLSQRFPVNQAGNPITASTVVLTAHEIGHNFSARHTNQVTSEMPPDIETPCDNTIMEASVGSGMSFCPMSRSQIIGHADARATCLQLSSSGPPGVTCVETPIDSGLFASGTLASGDCPSPARGVGFFADRYSFQGTAGQRLNITMTRTGGTFDPYLYLIGPSGFVISQNDDGAGGVDSRIAASGSFTLPDNGKYLIEATSFSTGETGAYNIAVALAGCTLSASATIQHFPAAGGNGTINVTATGGGCAASYQFTKSPSTAAWLIPQTTAGTGSQSLNFTVDPNTNSAGRRAFIVVGSALNDATGGLLIPITQSGTGPDCALTPISFGQTVGGTLTTSSCQSPIRGNNFYADRYVFTASAGHQIAVSMSSTGADPFISLIGPNGVVLLTDDDSGGGANARLPGGQGFLTLGLPGTYIIEASFCGPSSSGCAPGQTGSYSLTLTGSATAAPTILVEQGTANVAAAVDSVTHVKGPFTVLTPHNFSLDGRRRIILFTSDLGLAAGNTTGLSVRANPGAISLPLENAGPFSAIGGSYVIVRLDGLQPNNTYALTVTLNSVNSTNAPTIQIIP
ncbi:MAG TPA: M12 family metallo-peptidase [Pyrinomonadaceae bacterium]